MDMYSSIRNNASRKSSYQQLALRKLDRARTPLLMAGCLALLSTVALAAPIPIANSDFSDTGNDGSIGGGLIGGSGSGQINNGPWAGKYSGLLGLLAPPLLTISPGQASISSLAVTAVGLGNSGYFNQSLTASYVPVKHYVLAADVTAGSLLGLGVLTNGNIGLALTKGSNKVGSTKDSSLVSLRLLASDTYHLAVGYDSNASASGNIGVELFSEPNGILGADLFSAVAFGNVVLTEAPIPALPPASVAPASGSPQSVTVNNPFSKPLVVNVVDSQGDPLQGISVTFTAPNSGASVTQTSITVTTDVGGQASVDETANGIAGPYVVDASVSGVAQPAQFDLTNAGIGGTPASIAPASGSPQTATVNSAFSGPLVVNVLDPIGNPVQGVSVTFTAPNSGASVTQTPQTVMTDASGHASVNETANGVVGPYTVTASISGMIQTAQFILTNTGSGDPTLTGITNVDGTQVATVGQPFACMLAVEVVNGVLPEVGATVVFAAPDSGPSAMLSDGTNSGTMLVETTGSGGIAAVTATANSFAGSYNITVTATALISGPLGAPIPLTAFPMTNLAPLERLFANGFDQSPDLCGNL